MYRIGGRLGNTGVSLYGVIVGIPLLLCEGSNRPPLTGDGTMSGGQFDWGGRLQKSNGGAQSSPRCG